MPALNKYGYKNNQLDLISAIPSNEEKYISFSKKILVEEYKMKNKKTGKIIDKQVMFEIRFIDTIAFMPSSLCSLVDNLKMSCISNIKELKTLYPEISKQYNDSEDTKFLTSLIFNKSFKMDADSLKSMRNAFKNTSEEFQDDNDFLLMI